MGSTRGADLIRMLTVGAIAVKVRLVALIVFVVVEPHIGRTQKHLEDVPTAMFLVDNVSSGKTFLLKLVEMLKSLCAHWILAKANELNADVMGVNFMPVKKLNELRDAIFEFIFRLPYAIRQYVYIHWPGTWTSLESMLIISENFSKTMIHVAGALKVCLVERLYQ